MSFILCAIDTSADDKYVGVIKLMAHMLKGKKRKKMLRSYEIYIYLCPHFRLLPF